MLMENLIDTDYFKLLIDFGDTQMVVFVPFGTLFHNSTLYEV